MNPHATIPENKIAELNDLDKKVLKAIGNSTDLLDGYGYPATPAVRRITEQIGLDHTDEYAIRDVYYSIRFLTMRR
jgi:hypothetical protein